MLPVAVTVGGLAAADADGICASQSPGAAGAMTINGALASGGVATMDVARRVLITSAADDSDITFRVTGTNSDGNPIRETITGANASTVATTSDFKTVTEVYVSAATSGNVTVGTNGVASSRWVVVNTQVNPTNMSVAAIVSGTVNYTVEYTYDNPNDNANAMGSQALGNYPTVPDVFSHATLVNDTASGDGFFDNPIYAWRLKVNSGATGSDSVSATGVQAGVRS